MTFALPTIDQHLSCYYCAGHIAGPVWSWLIWTKNIVSPGQYGKAVCMIVYNWPQYFDYSNLFYLHCFIVVGIVNSECTNWGLLYPDDFATNCFCEMLQNLEIVFLILQNSCQHEEGSSSFFIYEVHSFFMLTAMWYFSLHRLFELSYNSSKYCKPF